MYFSEFLILKAFKSSSFKINKIRYKCIEKRRYLEMIEIIRMTEIDSRDKQKASRYAYLNASAKAVHAATPNRIRIPWQMETRGNTATRSIIFPPSPPIIFTPTARDYKLLLILLLSVALLFRSEKGEKGIRSFFYPDENQKGTSSTLFDSTNSCDLCKVQGTPPVTLFYRK